MNNLAKYCTIATALTVASLTYTTSAHAWGCLSEDYEGATGWSTGFNTKKKAAKRAVRECNNKSNTNECYVTECNVDW